MLQEIGLDAPQATLLVDALRHSGVDLPADIISVDECVEALAGLLGKEARA